MKKGGHIIKYNVDFWELASRVSWNEAALHNWYFCGLLLRLHTEVLHSGKPTTLAMLHLKAQDADNIYWMQEEESHIESKNLGLSSNPNKKDYNKSSNHSNTTSKPHNHPFSNNDSNLTSSKSTLKGPSKDKPKSNITDKLAPNGKLTGNERDHCMKEGFCLYCGEKGHIAHDCSKSAAAKAHAGKASAPETKHFSVETKQ